MKLNPHTLTSHIWHDGRTYTAHIPVPIADIKIPMNDEAVQLSIEADKALASLAADETLAAIPVEMMSLIEGTASSRIESIVASYPSVMAGFAGGKTDIASSLVMQNVSALRDVAQTETENKMTLDVFGDIHRTICSHESFAGELRAAQVWIGGRSPVHAIHVPPHHENVMECLEDWIEFVNRDDIPACLHIALAHAQFECIHPFADGNGRTGRAVSWWQLATKKLPLVPISSLLSVHIFDYYDALKAFQSGDPNPVINLFAKAVISCVESISSLASEWSEIGTSLKSKVPAESRTIIDIFRQHGAVIPKKLSELEGFSVSTARKRLNNLPSDVAVKHTCRGSSVWICRPYLRAAYRLNDYVYNVAGSAKNPLIETRFLDWRARRDVARMTYPTTDKHFSSLSQI